MNKKTQSSPKWTEAPETMHGEVPYPLPIGEGELTTPPVTPAED